MIIRPIQPADAPLLASAFAELSPESRYRRFFTPMKELDALQLAYLTDVDHHTTRRWLRSMRPAVRAPALRDTCA
jgi:hypothetical protein